MTEMTDTLAKATKAINEDREMSTRDTKDIGPQRLSATDTSESFELSFSNSLEQLRDARAQAEDEEQYWRARRLDIELTIDALSMAQKAMSTKYETAVPKAPANRPSL